MDVPAFITELGTLVVAFLVVIDPMAVLPVLVGIESNLDDVQRRLLIFRVIGGATVLLLLFTFAGTWFLGFFGVTLDDLRIGGGLLLVVIALNLVIHGRVSPDSAQEYHAAIVPLVSPLLIGPGAITAAVVFAVIHGVWITTLAALIAMFFAFLTFMASRFIYRLIGDSGTGLVSRVMGVFIVTIGVSYMRVGVLDLVKK